MLITSPATGFRFMADLQLCPLECLEFLLTIQSLGKYLFMQVLMHAGKGASSCGSTKALVTICVVLSTQIDNALYPPCLKQFYFKCFFSEQRGEMNISISFLAQFFNKLQ